MQNAVRYFPVARINNGRFRKAVEALHADFSAHVDPIHHESHLLLVNIASGIDTLKQVMAKDATSAYTDRKMAADEARDALTVFGVERIRTDARHYKPEIREAADALLPLVERRQGSFQTLGYDENSSELDQFLEDLATDGAQAHLAVLGLAEWHAELLAAAAAFEMVRSEERQAEGVVSEATLYPTKKLLAARFNLLFALAHYHADEGDTVFADLLRRATNTVNELKRYPNDPANPPSEDDGDLPPEAPAA